MWQIGVATALAVLTLVTPAGPVNPSPATLTYEVVTTYPHDPEAFTQGLEFRDEALFETTGLNGESTLRLVELETGEVLRSRSLPERFFGEGVTIVGNQIFWLTWQSHRAFVYRPSTFKRIGRFSYPGEGWGLTHNRRWLIMSNGSDVIRFRDPETFLPRKQIRVTLEGSPLEGLNELEWRRGSIFANVFPEDLVVRIDPATGEVTGVLDLSELRSAEEEQNGAADVTNGIAYIASEDRLFVTGKRWAHLYEIRLNE